MNKIGEIRERAEGNGIFRKSVVLVLLNEIDRLNARIAELEAQQEWHDASEPLDCVESSFRVYRWRELPRGEG